MRFCPPFPIPGEVLAVAAGPEAVCDHGPDAALPNRAYRRVRDGAAGLEELPKVTASARLASACADSRARHQAKMKGCWTSRGQRAAYQIRGLLEVVCLPVAGSQATDKPRRQPQPETHASFAAAWKICRKE